MYSGHSDDNVPTFPGIKYMYFIIIIQVGYSGQSDIVARKGVAHGGHTVRTGD